MLDFENYISPFSWRYSSPEMRRIWSEKNKRRTWRKIWVALAQVQLEYGLVNTDQLADLENNAENIDIERALQIEAEIHHDLMAELKTYAEQCHLGGGIIHLGATSMDIEDNADALRLRQSLDIILLKLGSLLSIFSKRISAWAEIPVIAFTHLQPAEPSTLGYRLAFYAQDLLADFEYLKRLRQQIKGKGFKGAVGTAAAYFELVGADQIDQFENRLSSALDLPFFTITTQTYPRRQDYEIISALAGLGAGLYKFAFDIRLLQSPPVGELSEPFGEKQIGSSAMPFKRNPILAEKIDSLSRALAQMPQLAWQNAAHSLLERTLDDSANRRSLLPEAFMICDEILRTAIKLMQGLQINQTNIERNLAIYAPFASTERLLMALVQAGANRQEMHENLRKYALLAWEAIQRGENNPLKKCVSEDDLFNKYLSADQIGSLFNVDGYVGIGPERSHQLAAAIQAVLNEDRQKD
ncbi:MAG: adenylosuccinate lyase [Anaerolineaceae bacterium]|nr:adenylosuccinate lyase [Anaerolineaceae bacterium]